MIATYNLIRNPHWFKKFCPRIRSTAASTMTKTNPMASCPSSVMRSWATPMCSISCPMMLTTLDLFQGNSGQFNSCHNSLDMTLAVLQVLRTGSMSRSKQRTFPISTPLLGFGPLKMHVTINISFVQFSSMLAQSRAMWPASLHWKQIGRPSWVE